MDKEFSLKEYEDIIEFIKEAHKGQYRKFSLCPYYVHPIRVASLVKKYKQSHKIDSLIVAALLHDVLEDTKITEQEIELCCSWQVLSLVQELTSNSEEQRNLGKTTYLSKKLCDMSSWALVIKLCDRLDNVMDFAYAEDKFIEKYAKETLFILDYCMVSRILSTTHMRIIADIRSQVNIYFVSK